MQQNIDEIDLGALILVPFMGAIALGTITLGVDVFGGFNFTDLIWSGSGVELSWAALITVLGITWIVATNELDGSNYEQWEYGVIVVMFALVPAYILIPPVADFINSSDIASFFSSLGLSAATIYISWAE
ncbi:hypothetical protein [Salinigranum halophilum]|uniref:hypothetical protein n=1 Tax=Salinigranum halophilum TaxID=2565931 RepID=UPI00115DB497|nr:hypothetical protein [Salinigranum halophilum]